MEKPELVIIDELKARIQNSINIALSEGLKAPVVELVLIQYMGQIKEMARNQTITETQQYTEAQKKEDEKE